ncbi:hypothetical protein CALVIDRAFT_325282 [Calocera viscosa TUFC12733]|uniref:Uncharacterized protein n=1 Tax=Calocera viscosa (strain TUFC12733) TaxID=1330018 RepID=A0A167QTU6_CALVF|nr:hypothetical protein CALVIDRAFT_325282 [Calocera viscosa TUFC12733]
MFFGKQSAVAAPTKNTIQCDPAYPRLMALSCRQQALPTGVASSAPSRDILPQLILDPKSAGCYIAQLDWYETQSGRDILVAQVGAQGSMWTDFIIELDSSLSKDGRVAPHAFPLSQATILHMDAFNIRMLQNERTPVAAVHYIPPAQLSLANFCRLLFSIGQYGRQKVASGPAPSNWLALVLYHCMDALIQPQEEEHWAANHPNISYATEPITTMIEHDVHATIQLFQSSGNGHRSSKSRDTDARM